MIPPFVTFLLLTALTTWVTCLTIQHIAHELRRSRRHH